MAEYIEREAAIAAIYDIQGPIHSREARALRELPAADVVEVVRCKDCKHYMTIHCTCDGCCISDYWYCADGERKDGEG